MYYFLLILFATKVKSTDIYLFFISPTGSKLPESQRGTFICVSCWWLLQTEHRLKSLLLSKHRSSKCSGGDQKPLSRSNHVSSYNTFWIKYHHLHAVWDISLISCFIRSEFAVSKLKKSGFKGGTFLLRQSPRNYDNFFLTVCVQVIVLVKGTL